MHLWLLDGKGACGLEAPALPAGLLDKGRAAWRAHARLRSRQQLDAADALHSLLEQRQLEALCGGDLGDDLADLARDLGDPGDDLGPGGLPARFPEIGRLALNAPAAADEEYTIDVAAELGGEPPGAIIVYLNLSTGIPGLAKQNLERRCVLRLILSVHSRNPWLPQTAPSRTPRPLGSETQAAGARL